MTCLHHQGGHIKERSDVWAQSVLDPYHVGLQHTARSPTLGLTLQLMIPGHRLLGRTASRAGPRVPDMSLQHIVRLYPNRVTIVSDQALDFAGGVLDEFVEKVQRRKHLKVAQGGGQTLHTGNRRPTHDILCGYRPTVAPGKSPSEPRTQDTHRPIQIAEANGAAPSLTHCELNDFGPPQCQKGKADGNGRDNRRDHKARRQSNIAGVRIFNHVGMNRNTVRNDRLSQAKPTTIQRLPQTRRRKPLIIWSRIREHSHRDIPLLDPLQHVLM